MQDRVASVASGSSTKIVKTNEGVSKNPGTTGPLPVPQWLTRVTGHYHNGGVSGTSFNGTGGGSSEGKAGPFFDLEQRRDSKTLYVPELELGISPRSDPKPGIKFEVVTPSPSTEFDVGPLFRNITSKVDEDEAGHLTVDLKNLGINDCQKEREKQITEPQHPRQFKSDSSTSECQKTALEYSTFKEKISHVVPFGEKFPVATKQSLDTLRGKSLGMAEDVEEELFTIDDDHKQANFNHPPTKHELNLTQSIQERKLPDNWFFRGRTSSQSDKNPIEKKVKEMKELNFHMPINM